MQPFRVLSGILDARQRRRYAWLQTYFVLAAVMQMASVASLAPFIALVSQPQLIQTNALAHLVYQHFGFSSDRSFLIAFAIALMVLIAISNLVPAVMSWLMWSFSQRLGAELQADMFRGVMHGDLASFARVNSAELVRNVLHGTNRLVYMVVQPVLNLVSSTFVIVLITAGLVIFDPLVAVVAAVLIAGGYAVVFLLSERRLAQHGTRTWRAVEQKTRLLNESFGGLREIRLAGTAERYERRLDEITKGSLRSEAMLGMLGELPRYVLETIALCALLGLGVYLLLSKRETSSIVAILSLYAMAGYRLLPAAQIAFRSATTIRANVDALQSLEPAIRLGREVEKPNEPAVELLALGAVEFRSVRFHYPETTKPVLEDVSFRIEPNTITAIVGTSGSGKSTIASLLLGLLRPAEGDITVAGQSIRTCTRSWQDRLAYVSQHVFLVDDSIATNIALGSRGTPDLGRVERAARQASLSEFIESLPARYDHGVGEHGSLLSGGQRQRIGIARALYNDADVIVLDEPTSALDSATEAGIIATLEGLRATKTIVMISHRMSTLRSADRILMLEEGRVHAFGTFDELFERVESFRKLVLSEVTESAADGTGRSGESISATA